MTTFNIRNYYMPKLSEAPADAFRITAWTFFTKLFANGKLLLRVSAPIATLGFPSGGSINSTNGLGDINAFLSYNFVSKPNATMGLGTLLFVPTGTEKIIGSLVTWLPSFAREDDRDSTNLSTIQPFYFWELGKGTYQRGAPIWVFYFEKEAYLIPISLGFGQVIKVGNTVFNFFVEPQLSMLIEGTQPLLWIFTGINLQFIGK